MKNEAIRLPNHCSNIRYKAVVSFILRLRFVFPALAQNDTKNAKQYCNTLSCCSPTGHSGGAHGRYGETNEPTITSYSKIYSQ